MAKKSELTVPQKKALESLVARGKAKDIDEAQKLVAKRSAEVADARAKRVAERKGAKKAAAKKAPAKKAAAKKGEAE